MGYMSSIQHIINQQLISANPLKEFSSQILQKVNLPQSDAGLVADSLVFANSRGIDTHGVSRLGLYVQRIEKRVMKARPDLKIIKDKGATLLVDGDDGMGQVIAEYAMKLAIERAAETGIALVGVRNSGHLGCLAYWSMMALPYKLIGICATNTSAILAPWGGKKPVLGNNPFSIAAPTRKGFPLVLDMALSIEARGNIILASKKGEKIPDGWAIDKNGHPTQDPQRALEGSVLPIGGHKGSALSLMIDVITGVLMGSAFGKDCALTVPPDLSKPFGFAHLMIAIRIDNFIPMEEFLKRLDILIEQIKQSPLAKGFKEILLPGEKEFLVEKKRKEEGIPLSESTVNELNFLAGKFNLPPLFKDP